MIDRIIKFINKLDAKYLMKIIVGLIITIKCKEIAYLERGYFAIGGEYLIVPLYLTIRYGIKYLMDQNKNQKEAVEERVEKVDRNVEAA